MKRTRLAALAAVPLTALLLAGCASSTEPVAAPDVSASAPAPSADAQEIEWANPDAPEALKFMKTDLVTGETIDGTSLMHKDVVLWFWASWCPICNAEAGAMLNASAEFDEDITVLGIAGLSDTEESNGFIEEHELVTFAHIYDDDGTIWRNFNVAGQPTMILVNQDGRTQTYSGGYGKFDIIDKVAWLAEN
jgi:peroxiredoxin